MIIYQRNKQGRKVNTSLGFAEQLLFHEKYKKTNKSVLLKYLSAGKEFIRVFELV